MPTPTPPPVASGDRVRHAGGPDPLLVLSVVAGEASCLHLVTGATVRHPAGELLPLPAGPPGEAADPEPGE